MGYSLFRRVVARLVTLGPRENPQECRIAIRHPMAEGESADEHCDSGKNRVEEIKSTNLADAHEVE
jgi:hypothetical protein